MTQDRPFMMGFKDAMMYDIDYRDYEKVRELPKGVKLTAVAGIWGDYANLRYLFFSDDGKQYCRTVWSRSRYFIPQIEIHDKEICVGLCFIALGLSQSQPTSIPIKVQPTHFDDPAKVEEEGLLAGRKTHGT